MEEIKNIILQYNVWIHFITAVILLVIISYWAWKTCVNSITYTADNSKYAYLIIKWILAQKKREMTPEIEKKFINVKDMEAILKMNNFLNTVKSASLEKCTYKELKHPFFVWHDVVFVRTNGNDVVRVDNGQMGKIRDEEEIEAIVISDSFAKIMCAVEYAIKMQEHFNEIK